MCLVEALAGSPNFFLKDVGYRVAYKKKAKKHQCDPGFPSFLKTCETLAKSKRFLIESLGCILIHKKTLGPMMSYVGDLSLI